MSDNFIAASLSLVAGGVTASQAATLSLPMPEIVLTTILAMIASGLVTWGMFRKATEKNEEELKILRESLTHMVATLAEVRERVARIEGRLEER